jgi:small subunit ribosomal protein S20
MPNLKAAKKDLRQTKKRTERNSLIKSKVRDFIRQSRKAAEKNDLVKTEEYVNLAIKALDKALKNNIYKQNTVSRRKSILMRRLNSVKSSK